MKAERAKANPEFVPVIVTLESQEEVDSLYAIGQHEVVGGALPALDHWYRQLAPFIVPHNAGELWYRLNKVIR